MGSRRIKCQPKSRSTTTCAADAEGLCCHFSKAFSRSHFGTGRVTAEVLKSWQNNTPRNHRADSDVVWRVLLRHRVTTCAPKDGIKSTSTCSRFGVAPGEADRSHTRGNIVVLDRRLSDRLAEQLGIIRT